jgi:hypothetical protein
MATITDLSEVELQQQQHKQWVDCLRAQYIDYPFEVAFETLALCNASCDFCPYPTLTERAGSRMSDALIEKIINDLTEIPPAVWFQVNPGGISERFLDSRIFDIFELINRRLPGAGLPLNSNGSTLTEGNLLRLVQIKKIVSLNVSLNEFRPERYEQVMGLPFGRTITHLNMLHELKLANRAYFPIVVSCVRDGTEEDQRFVEWVREHYPGFETTLLVRGDFLGNVQIHGPLVLAPSIPCSQWFKLRIWADGRIALCCLDAQPVPEHGHAATHRLLDVYNQPARRHRRLSVLSRLEVDVCSRCNMLV